MPGARRRGRPRIWPGWTTSTKMRASAIHVTRRESWSLCLFLLTDSSKGKSGNISWSLCLFLLTDSSKGKSGRVSQEKRTQRPRFSTSDVYRRGPHLYSACVQCGPIMNAEELYYQLCALPLLCLYQQKFLFVCELFLVTKIVSNPVFKFSVTS